MRMHVEPESAFGSADDHMRVHGQLGGGCYVGTPLPAGLPSGDQALAIASLVEDQGGDVPFTRRQNLILTGISSSDVAWQDENLAAAFLCDRGDDEPFHAFATRRSDEELLALASGECGTAIEAHAVTATPRS